MNDVTPDNASFFNLPDASGAIVSSVVPDSPASRAGLKNGDVLRMLNGRPVTDGGALQVAVSKISPGSSIELGILRDGKPQTLRVAVGEFHKDAEVATNDGEGSDQHGKLGLTVSDLTPDVRSQLNVGDQIHGAVVEGVRPASPADDAQLAPGDIILEVNRHPVEDADRFASAIHSVPAGKNILLLVLSHGGTTYRVVHPDENAQGGL
jgi:serine protease Do